MGGLRNPKQKQARALKMLESRIMEGKTTKEIAKDFNVRPETVKAALSLAAKADLIIAFEDKLVNELLPLAHEAVLAGLMEGNAKIGLEVLKGTQVLRPSQPRSQAQAADDDELSRYIAHKRKLASQAEHTFDAEYTVTGPQPALAPSSAGRITGNLLFSPESSNAEPSPTQTPRPDSRPTDQTLHSELTKEGS